MEDYMNGGLLCVSHPRLNRLLRFAATHIHVPLLRALVGRAKHVNEVDGDGRAAIESRGHRIDVVVQRDARQERDGDERGDGTGGAFEEDDGKDDAKAHDGVESDVRGRGEDVDREREERVLG